MMATVFYFVLRNNQEYFRILVVLEIGKKRNEKKEKAAGSLIVFKDVVLNGCFIATKV